MFVDNSNKLQNPFVAFPLTSIISLIFVVASPQYSDIKFSNRTVKLLDKSPCVIAFEIVNVVPVL